MEEAPYDVIARTVLFRGVAPETVREALDAVRTARAGELLAVAGARASSAFVVLGGELLATEDVGAARFHCVLRAGELAGEEAVWGARAYVRTVVARNAARIAIFHGASLARRARSDPSLAYNVAALMFARLRDARLLIGSATT